MDTGRIISRRGVFASGAALGAAAMIAGQRAVLPRAASAGDTPPQPPRHGSALVPMHPRVDQITDLKVCIRPFRAAGPRLDVERIGNKIVFHNYGHGGSGWSLSWGSANLVVGNVAATLNRKVAVIGCGIVGLTAALTAQRAGFDVTIYARDLLPHTRSVRANGSWTPDSRIALTQTAAPGFADQWEQMARFSWATYRTYLGLPGAPIMFEDNYILSDTSFENQHPTPAPSEAPGAMPRVSEDFARYSGRIRDIVPAAEDVPPAENPFAAPHARRRSLMIYNFGAYGHLLLSEFHQAGGRIVIREFHSPHDLTTLPEKVIINCPGYAAREWWRDDSLVPVRGQTAWLPPRPDAPYGLVYRGAALLSKTDGVMIQAFDLDGLGEMTGVGNSLEHPDPAEAARAIGVFADLFARMPAAAG
ncbi:FAD-dependent oxidoreductase [Gluconacetobacter sacchari]|nr:FAD-dependent oxidoreductase [Gluconacetobacter sacchari]